MSEHTLHPPGYSDVLERGTGIRKDWPRIDEKEFREDVESYVRKHTHPGDHLFPIQNTPMIQRIADQESLHVIGNQLSALAQLDRREEGRSIANDVGMRTLSTLTLPCCQPISFDQAKHELGSAHLVLAGEHSSGGAWVFAVRDDAQFEAALTELRASGAHSSIEISAFQPGCPVNITVCLLDTNQYAPSVVVYPPSMQLIGHPGLTDDKLRYCGCRFPLPDACMKLMPKAKLLGLIRELAMELHRRYGYRGLFGIDFVVTPRGQLVFLEINPRLQTSTSILDRAFRNDLNPLRLHMRAFDQLDRTPPPAAPPGRDSTHGLLDLTAQTIHQSLEIQYNASADTRFQPYREHLDLPDHANRPRLRLEPGAIQSVKIAQGEPHTRRKRSPKVAAHPQV